MAISFKWYADNGLTQELTSLGVTRPDSGAGFVDRAIYLGSQYQDGRFLRSALNPGVSPITLSVVEISPSGGVLAAHVALAYSAEELDAAIFGAALEMQPTIYSNPSNAAVVHVRIATPALSAGVYDNIQLVTDDVIELGV